MDELTKIEDELPDKGQMVECKKFYFRLAWQQIACACVSLLIICTKMSSRMRILMLVSCCLLIGVFPSCNKDDISPGRIIRIDDDFNLTIWEGLSESGSEVQILVTTNRALDCENYLIDLEKTVNFTTIYLRLNGVIKPENCEGSEGWPLDTVTVGNLSPRRYNFEVVIGGEITNIGHIDISADQIITNFSETNGFSLSNEVLNRIEPNMYWGAVTYTSGNENLATVFFDSLKTIATNEPLIQGNYGRFIVDGNTISIPAASDEPNVTSFIFRIEEPVSDVSQLIESFRQDYGDDIEIEAWNGRGDSF